MANESPEFQERAGAGGATEMLGSDRVSEALADIVHQLGPGARLPSERELAARVGVSRTTLRDRLQVLESLGVITRRQGSGTYVQPLNPAGLTMALNLGISSCHLTLQDLNSVRVALERQAAMEAARVGDPVHIAYLEKAVNTIAYADEDAAVDEADFSFHDALLRASANPALSFFADALGGVLHRALAERRAEMRRRLDEQNEQEVMVALHRRVWEAVRAGDPEAAAAAVDAHFDTYSRLIHGWSDKGR